MGTRWIVGALATGALLVTLGGCGSSAATSPSPAAADTQAASASESAAAPSAAESSAAESAAASFAIPSFTLPSGAKDLEALLPAKLCGETAIKLSMSGAQFTSSADPTFKAILQALGKQASDVSFAIAGAPTGGCTAGIFRISGVDQNLLQQAFLAEEQKTGVTPTQASIGGKSVFVAKQTSGSNEYVYFKGDAAIFAQGKDEASATGILQQLP
jgi:pyruvate/2-oxoglutarate dehydrogenase complex dihydrolipoamide acyltransferase (E2) component